MIFVSVKTAWEVLQSINKITHKSVSEAFKFIQIPLQIFWIILRFFNTHAKMVLSLFKGEEGVE